MTVTKQDRQVVDGQAPHWMPNSDIDLWERMTTYHYGGPGAITDHFRGSALLAGWAWAAAPFVTPTTVTISRSVLRASFAAPNRAFLYQGTVATSGVMAAVGLWSPTQNFACGLRMDDGTDDNYAEVVLRVSQASPTQWAVQARYRAGGGVVTTAGGDAISEPDFYRLRMGITGTPWTAWGFYPLLNGPTANMIMWKPITDLAAGGAAWTPTRVGLVFDDLVGSLAPYQAYVDWCDLDIA